MGERVQVREIIIAALLQVVPTLDASAIGDEQNLLESGIDSANFLEMVVLLEEHYTTEIDFLSVDPVELTTIKGLVKAFSGNL